MRAVMNEKKVILNLVTMMMRALLCLIGFWSDAESRIGAYYLICQILGEREQLFCGGRFELLSF